MLRRRRPADQSDPAADRRNAIIAALSAPDYAPLKPTELWRSMGVPEHERLDAEDVLARMIRAGTVILLKHKGLALAQAADLLTGNIRFLRSGAALVTGEDRREAFIPPGAAHTAMPGDNVLVRLEPKRPGDRDRGPGMAPTGRVIRVVEHITVTLVGTLYRQAKLCYVKPMSAGLTHDVVVADPGDAQVGDRVLVKIEAWDEPSVSPEGSIVEIIGPADNPAFDTLAVAKSHQLPLAFPPAVIAAAARLQLPADPGAGRRDLRRDFVFTIDPATARDFDDAISLTALPGGHWELGVHIADVAHFMPPGSVLDKEAVARGNSVYFPDLVIPMLPEQLSNGLCSLVPKQDRLTLSAFMTLDGDANVLATSFAETVICSALRLTYEQAMAALLTPPGADYPAAGMDAEAVRVLKQVRELAMAVRRRRFAAGALNLEVPEVRFSLSPDGRIGDLQPVYNDESHQLIEECMLLANESVCKALCDIDFPHLHRIHDDPDPESLAELEIMFTRLGFDVGDLTQRSEMAALLNQLEGRPEAPAWSSSVLRSFKRALYAVEATGHYGLAKEFYTHFTSPIRRYPDLLVHRALKAHLHRQGPPYGKAVLAELAAHCSHTEEVATAAERELVELKRLRFFAEQLAAGEPRAYDAVVTEARNFGVFIFVPAAQAYGMIHVSQLADDFYDFQADTAELVGRSTGFRLASGALVRVRISRVDTDRKQLDFALVKEGEEEGGLPYPRLGLTSKDAARRQPSRAPGGYPARDGGRPSKNANRASRRQAGQPRDAGGAHPRGGASAPVKPRRGKGSGGQQGGGRPSGGSKGPGRKKR